MDLDTSNPFEALAALKPAVRLTTPPSWFFKFPPSPLPQTLPPPSSEPTLAHPFTIPIDTYNALLDVKIPLTVALLYITIISYLNSVNKSRKQKPWAFSKTALFKLLVIVHNIVLAVYSAWTFVGMVNALQIAVYNPYRTWGLAGTVDSLCKINGPRGVGSAATYNETTSAYGIVNRFFHLGADGLTPDVTDVGRIWNEGLAFYGWLFYLSKFYEVIDTLIIIAKGKRSSFLQTYHHAGAMLCMWAGIRYMSPPIWMFVLVNSFIHSIMYSFYLCSAIGIRVPVWFKRSLTTLQITQFVVGVIYAGSHLFIKYQSPISTPYTFQLGTAARAVTSDASSALATATASASADVAAILKKALLRAAGREGLAENVLNKQGRTFGIDAAKAAEDLVHRSETRYRDELLWVDCLDTSGQAFAIYLNVLYLAPLTWLFVRFFIRSYLGRLERRRSSTASQRAQDVAGSFADARKGVDRRLSQAFEDAQGGADESDGEFAIIDEEEFQAEKEVVKAKGKAAAANVKQTVESTTEKVKQEAGPTIESAKKKSQSAAKAVGRTANNVKEEVDRVLAESNKGMAYTLDNARRQADSVKAQTEEASQEGFKKAQALVESTTTTLKDYKDAAVEKAPSEARVKELVNTATETGSEILEKSAGVIQDSASSAVESAKAAITSAKKTTTSDWTGGDDQSSKGKSQEEGASKGGREEASNSADTEKRVDSHDSKEKVRETPVNKETSAETGAGDTGKDKASARKGNAPGRKSKDPSTTEKPNQEDFPVKDSGNEANSGKGVSGQNTSNKTTHTGRNMKGNSKQNKKSESGSAPSKNENPNEDSQGGRQDLFDDERGSALEKLTSANTEGSDQVIPDKSELSVEDDDNLEKHDQETEQKAAKAKKGDESAPSFEEDRSAALKKLESASEEDGSHAQRDAKAGQDESTKAKSTQNSQDFEDQNQSWIHVDDGDKPTFADVVKSDAKDEDQSTEEQSKGNDDHAVDTKQTADSSQPQNPDTQGSKDNKNGPEWFERLTASTDSPSKVKHQKGDHETDKDAMESEDKHSTTNDQSAEKEKAVQDKIIDESEPVRDNISSEADDADVPPPSSPQTPSKRWHQRRKG